MREHRNDTDRASQLRRRPSPEWGVRRASARQRRPPPEDVVRAKLAAAEDTLTTREGDVGARALEPVDSRRQG